MCDYQLLTKTSGPWKLVNENVGLIVKSHSLHIKSSSLFDDSDLNLPNFNWSMLLTEV
jgi:hypothetical protein